MTERLIFGSSVEGMLRALGPLTPALREKLKALGVDPDKLLPAYEVPTYVRLLDFIGQQRFPGLPNDERDRELGREFIRGFSQTFIGRAALATGRVLGPMRATKRFTRTMRTVTNYSQAEATPLSDTAVRVWCEPVVRPWYYVGVLEEAGLQLHGPGYRVRLEKVDGERVEFLIDWG